MRILLIEDNEGDALHIKTQLKVEPEFRVEIEDSLLAGIERANGQAFDLVVLDLSLPDSDGLETLHEFFACVESPPAVVLLTDEDCRDLALEAVQAGAQDYVAKGALDPRHLVLAFRNSVERHRMAHELMAAHERVQFLATHCALTGLPNRYLFMDRLTAAIGAAARSGGKPVVACLDLTRFKTVNENLGHDAGDMVLRAVAERINHVVRKSDTAARLAGDEFSVLFSETPDASTISRVVARMAASISQPISIAGREVVLQPAIGIAVYPEDGTTSQALMRNADAAMYAARERGESHRFWATSLQHSEQDRLAFERDLSNAIQNQKIEIYFQPRVDGDSGRISGLEALARWNRKGQGWVPPSEFIDVAETSGLIDELGLWMLRSACRMQKEWRDRGIARGPVAVNVSPRQLRGFGFARTVTLILEDYGLPGEAIELEITESCLIDNEAVGERVLHELRDYGIRIAVDDFGTGYSNLGRLADLPVDQLKVDRRFVLAAMDNPRQAMTTRAIIALGNELDLEVVAEGVETDEQRRFLLAENCNSMQGFLFAKPMPESEVVELLRTGFVEWTEDQ